MGSDPAEVVLIVEDEPGVAQLQRKRLERAGYRVRWAATAADARAALATGDVDLLALDYRLPDAPDGLAFYQELKASGLDLPVILVTGYPDDRTVVKALRAGVRDYVTKSPEYLDYLPEAVRRVLDQQRNARERRRAEEALRETNRKLEAALAELRDQADELAATTQQLWQAAKLATVGELAASVAHELNNPLGTVSLRLESVLARTPPDDPRRPALEVVEQEVERMARLIANLLQFSRQAPEQVSTVDVAGEVTRTAELAEHHLRRRGVTVAFDFATDLPPIIADRQKLRQLFLNLYTNAADAMPHGGVLTTRVFPQRDPAGRSDVMIEVADTGVGIPADLLPRVMDPFFTTKDEGKGTGLGLAICRRIVHDHQGTIHIDSEVGQGTTVRIALPALPRQKA
jgi:signal transduction histidine kinase